MEKILKVNNMFKFIIWCEGNGWEQDDFESYDEAYDGACEKIDDLLDDWQDELYSYDDFEIEIIEY